MRLGPIGVRAQENPDGSAVADDGQVLTWRELADQVRSVAGYFSTLATDPDQRIGVLGDNRAETVVAHVAGILAGVGTVALSRQLTERELIEQVADATVVALVAGPSSVDAGRLAASSAGIPVIAHGVVTAPAGVTPWVAVTSTPELAPPEGQVALRPPRPPIVYTSGTTGRARGTEVRWLPRSYLTAADYAAAVSARSSFPPGPHLVVGPLQHNGPLTCLRHILAGEPLVVLGKYDAERVLELIQAHGITSSVMVPTHFQRLLALPEQTRQRYDVSTLRTVAHTGSACPADVKRAMIDWWGPVFTESYGGSEIGTVCRITSEEWLAHPRSVGRCVPPFEAVVVDEQGTELPPGATGVLGFRAPEEYDVRYHGDPEKTAAAHIAPGVATLGDVGHVDAQGYVYITDRVADMVISGGVNLYPAEIERVLLEHPAVAEAAVIGVPHPDLGEALLAIVVLTDSPPRPTERDLVDFMKQSLAAYKVPRSFRFVHEIERTAMGKIDKKALRSVYKEVSAT